MAELSRSPPRRGQRLIPPFIDGWEAGHPGASTLDTRASSRVPVRNHGAELKSHRVARLPTDPPQSPDPAPTAPGSAEAGRSGGAFGETDRALSAVVVQRRPVRRPADDDRGPRRGRLPQFRYPPERH